MRASAYLRNMFSRLPRLRLWYSAGHWCRSTRLARICGILALLCVAATLLQFTVRPFGRWVSVGQNTAYAMDDAPPVELPPELVGVPGAILARLSTQHQEVQTLLDEEADSGFSTADLLVMLGRSSAASGKFELSAAAYAMFLDQLGPQHQYSQEVALRLGESLAPFNLDHTGVAHALTGPQPIMRWRTGSPPSDPSLQDAAMAFQYAAASGSDQEIIGQALVYLGWTHRARSDWEASTAAWDQCVAAVPGTPFAAEALRKAADNLAWTGQPLAAADRLTTLAEDYAGVVDDVNIPHLIENLQAEGQRTAAWLDDPVASLQAEIQQRAGALPVQAVYASVADWLQRTHQDDALITISQWACTQTDWPLEARLECHDTLVQALLRKAAAEQDTAAKEQAASVLASIMDFAPSDELYLQAAQVRYRLLHDLEQYNLADQTWQESASRFQGLPVWEPIFLEAKIRSLLTAGDTVAAEATFSQLQETYPGYKLTWESLQNDNESEDN